MDFQILFFIQTHIRNTVFTPFFIGITNEYFLLCLLILLFVYMYKKQNQKQFVKSTLFSFILCLLFFIILKKCFQRPRPFDLYPQIIPLVKKPHDFSFPSGHTACAFICAFMAYRQLDKKFSIPIVIFAILVAFSRLYVGVHYPSDILGGILLAYILYKIAFKSYAR